MEPSTTLSITQAILRTVEAGWALALKSPDVNVDAAEVPMTERLRDGRRSALNGGGRPWGRTLVVLPGTGSRSVLTCRWLPRARNGARQVP